MSVEFRFYLGAIIALFILLLIWLAADPANAQQQAAPPCGTEASILAFFEKRHGERPQWRGGMQDGTQFMLLVSRKNTWTLIRTDGKHACALSAGDGSAFKVGEPV